MMLRKPISKIMKKQGHQRIAGTLNRTRVHLISMPIPAPA
jgi:hypothetical protein